MQEITTLGLSGGFNTDSDKAYYDGKSYLMATNFTATSTGGSTLGALENVKGNELISEIDFGLNHQLIGYANIVKDIVFFTTDGTNSKIHLYSGNTLTTLFDDTSKLDKLEFSLDPQYRIVAVGRQETGDIKKVYWVDGINELRYIDLNRSYVSSPSSSLNAIPPNDLSATIDSEILPGAGSYKSGTVYYYYQYYVNNGASSTIGGSTIPVKLSQYSTIKDGGSDKGEDSNCAVNVTISDISSDVLNNYNRIRLYAVFYDNLNFPQINIVAERPIINNRISILDVGNIIGELTIDEFASLKQTTYIPKAIESNKNHLLIGNLKEGTFNNSAIDNWDARAYRFNLSNEANITSVDGDTSKDIVVDSIFKSTYNVPALNILAGDDIPEDHDCYNEYNKIYEYSLQYRLLNNKDNRYKLNGDIGGEGLNIEYDFITDWSRTIDDTVTNSVSESEDFVKTNQSDIYYDLGGDPTSLIECEDGEVYRVGIKFYNAKGQSSFVKWVGDVLWEESFDRPSLDRVNILTGGTTEGSSSKPAILKITLKNNTALQSLKDAGVVSWQVVRAKRTSIDKSSVANGVLYQFYRSQPGDSYRIPFNATNLKKYNDNIGSSTTYANDLFKFISPDTMFNQAGVKNLDNFKVRVYNKASNLESDSYPSISDNPAAYAKKFRSLKNLDVTGNNVALGNLINIGDYVYVDPVHIKETPVNQEVSIGGYQILNRLRAFTINLITDMYAGGCSSYVIKLNNIIATQGSDLTDENSWFYASLISNKDFSRYGGSSYQDILSTQYIPFSKTSDISILSNICVYGDSYTTPFYYLNGIYQDITGDSNYPFHELHSFPVQSQIDLRKRNDRLLDFITGVREVREGTDLDNVMHPQETVEEGIEEQGTKYDTSIGDLYVYNPSYSAQNNPMPSFSKPFDFTEEDHITTKVLSSEKKINGESEDMWTNFLPNNFIEVDTAYGELNDLKTMDKHLFFWQEKAFGTLAVNDRSLITDESGAQLSLGTGGVLERYDYISNEIGNLDKYNISKSENALFWNYTPKNAIYRYNGQLEEISTTRGISKYMKDNPTTNPVSVSDFKSKETVLSVGDNALIFDWITDKFTGDYSYTPKWFIPEFDGNFISSPDGVSLYRHNSDDVVRGTFYGTPYNSSLSHICNVDYDSTKVFDVLNWHSTSKTNRDVPLRTETSLNNDSISQNRPILILSIDPTVNNELLKCTFDIKYTDSTTPSLINQFAGEQFLNNADVSNASVSSTDVPYTKSNDWTTVNIPIITNTAGNSTWETPIYSIKPRYNSSNPSLYTGAIFEIRNIVLQDSLNNVIPIDNYSVSSSFMDLSVHPAIYKGVDQYEDTFSKYRIYDDYQNTGWQNIKWRRKERSFTTIIPRDKVNQPQSANVDIFKPTNLDTGTLLHKRRIRDKWIAIDLEYVNKPNVTFSIPYINVGYRNSIR